MEEALHTEIFRRAYTGVTLTELNALARSINRGAKSKEIRGVLDDMESKSLVTKVRIKPAGGGRPTTRYYPQVTL